MNLFIDIIGWVLVVFLLIGAISTIRTIGQPRKPVTGEIAAVSTVVSALLLFVLIFFLTGGR